MIDIHSHILNGVDDGSESLSCSIEILSKAEEAGFTDIILTPHFIENYYENTKSSTRPKITKMKKELYNENIIVQLHGGNEIYLSENTPDLIKNGKISTLANSKYVLFEVPFSNKMLNLAPIVAEIKSNGYIPVIAHPERYAYIQENPNEITEILNMGVFLQCNYGSVVGQYGRAAKRTVEILLENHLVHFMGSDTHKHGFVYENISSIISRMEELTKDKFYVNEITTNNPKNIINDIEMYIDDYPKKIEEKKKFSLFSLFV